MEISWLQSLADSWRERLDRQRMPHAVLLTGPVGVGKRAAASWMVSLRLGAGSPKSLPQHPVPAVEHADLHWVRPAEDKTMIGIEQIRELVAQIGLTSYAGSGKAAVIEPANAMTQNAANSLLKTLEEPPGDALLILVADRNGYLPATIFSRCQRFDVRPPGEAEALAWLDRLQPGAAWAEALAQTGNAPLAAIDALEQRDTHAALARDLREVATGASPVLDVAERWARLDAGFVLDWLARQVVQSICRTVAKRGSPVAGGVDESVLQRMDRRNLFCYLDTINRLRGQSAGSFNVRLTMESLLIDWAEGLVNVGREPAGGLSTR